MERDAASWRAEVAAAVRAACSRDLAEQAEDLAHEVLVRVLERGEGNPARGASYWRKAAYHAVVDELRRRRRRGEEMLDEDRVQSPGAGAHDPERRATGREIADAIAACVGRLGESRRLPVVLFLQGHSAPESAELLGWAVKRVESGLYRGLRDLRHCLTRKGWRP